MKKPYFKPTVNRTLIKIDSLLVVLSGNPKDNVVAGARGMDMMEEDEELMSRKHVTVWDDEEEMVEEEEY